MNRSRLPIVLLLVVSLLAAGLTRQWASAERNSGRGALPVASGRTGLSRMNSYALALLLGGLRGPLVMFLWPSAEDQKSEKNLEDFDTKIEWIRLLQAEFDTVHLFQIWNKAYNISAQMASLSNKYHAILDAIDYAKSVDAEKPNDVNIVHGIAGVYFDKLGLSAEQDYYRERIRQETKARQQMVRITFPANREPQLTELLTGAGVASSDVRFSEPAADNSVSITLPKPLVEQFQSRFSYPDVKYVDRPLVTISRDDPGWRRTEQDPLLDANGYILPEYLSVTNPRPANLDPSVEWNDGSELQYLKKYQPFKYGISPLALGYNYFKRAQVLVTEKKQKHAQISDESIGSRPAFALKTWSEEEWARGRRAELDVFGKPLPASRTDMETVTADFGLDRLVVHPKRMTEALDDYSLAIRLVDDALKEYERHLSYSKINFSVYLSHMNDLRAEKQLVLGDKAFLDAINTPAERAQKIPDALKDYREALKQYETIVLQYYVPPEMLPSVFPPGTTPATFAQTFDGAQIDELFTRFRERLPRRLTNLDNGDIIDEYLHYIDRANARIRTLSQ
jgi:tetratricopeptide (TPR) repeat protein